jgi:hypothetical protein
MVVVEAVVEAVVAVALRYFADDYCTASQLNFCTETRE